MFLTCYNFSLKLSRLDSTAEQAEVLAVEIEAAVVRAQADTPHSN